MDGEPVSANAVPVAVALAHDVARARARPIPGALRETCERLLVDIAGLCIAARNEPYVRAALQSWESDGDATVIGHRRALDSRAQRS